VSTRIAFAGTPEFAVPTLERIVAAGYDVPVVLTQPDRPAGRGRRLTASPVKLAATAHGIDVRQPLRLQDPALLAGVDCDALVVVAYGLLLPQWVLDWPAVGCLNVHASMLPRWRGAAPIQHAILAGDRQTGVCLMHIERGLDSGAIYAVRSVGIGDDETAGELHAHLAEAGAALLVEQLPAIVARTLRPEPQPPVGVTYAPKIAKSDARLDWHAPADVLARRVRAFNPWPVAEGLLSDGRRLRIWRARAVAAETEARPGTIVAATPDGIDVAAGTGLLRLLRVQPPAARAMESGAYLAAHALDGVAFVD
jgi:methionyl-tRNA formyltransferase